MALTHDPIHVGQLTIQYLRDGSADASMGTFELTVPPQSNVPPPHSHANNDEFIYVLEGTLRYTVGAQTRDLVAGDFAFTPRGTVHGFGNPHTAAARALVTNTPDIGSQYFRDIAAVVNAGGPPDKTKIVAVMSKFGLTLPTPAAAP